MDTFSFNPAINLSEERKWLLAVASFEATNSVSNITDDNTSFCFSTPDYWSDLDTGDRMMEFLQLTSHNDLELRAKNVEKRPFLDIGTNISFSTELGFFLK